MPKCFAPRVATGFFFASLAALMYGTSPIIIRQAIHDAGPLGGVVGGLIAYAAATCTVALGLLIPSLRRNVMQVSRESARWFVYSGIFVAAAQGFLYSALALAPIMLVVPLLQLSLVFRFLFAFLFNPHHELFGAMVVIGSAVSIVGACAVSINTDLLVGIAPAAASARRPAARSTLTARRQSLCKAAASSATEMVSSARIASRTRTALAWGTVSSAEAKNFSAMPPASSARSPEPLLIGT